MVKHWSPKPNTAGSSPVFPDLIFRLFFFHIIFNKNFNFCKVIRNFFKIAK